MFLVLKILDLSGILELNLEIDSVGWKGRNGCLGGNI